MNEKIPWEQSLSLLKFNVRAVSSMQPPLQLQTTLSYEVQTMFSDLMTIRQCPETLSELRSLCGFYFIESVR